MRDRNYLLKTYPTGEIVLGSIPSKNTRLAEQKIILQCHNYRSFSQNEHQMLLGKAAHLAKIHVQPHFMLTELLRILEAGRITVPGYSTFQKIIGSATFGEQQRLSSY